MRSVPLVLLSLAGACAVPSISKIGQVGGTGRSASGASTAAAASPVPTRAGSGKMIVPDLIGQPQAAAVAALRAAGLTGGVTYQQGACGSVAGTRIIERGHVCRQHPVGGREHVARLSVSLLIQHEDPRHGNVGQPDEWHLMPDVVGMPIDQARAAIRAAGFDDSLTDIVVRDVTGCQPGRVCRQNPTALQRSARKAGRYLVVTGTR